MRIISQHGITRVIILASAAVLAVAVALSIPARKLRAAGPTDTTIDYPGAVASLGTDINDSGQIVGEYTFSDMGHRQGFLLSSGVFTPISFPGSTFTRAVGINRYGDIVGDHDKAGNNGGLGHDEGYLFHNGVYSTFAFPNSDLTIAAGINANGDIVGWYLDNKGTHGFLFSGRTFTPIDFPGAAADTEAWKINDFGEIAGRYKGATDGKFHVFILSDGSFTAIPDDPDAFETAVVEDGGLNSAGQIVSQYHSSNQCKLFISSGCLHGFLFSSGVYTTIDYPNSTETLVLGINSSQAVVGGYEDTSGKFHAFLRTP